MTHPDFVVIGHCELCNAPLCRDEVYGPPGGMDLCRACHEKFYELLGFMVESTKRERAERLNNQIQPALF